MNELLKVFLVWLSGFAAMSICGFIFTKKQVSIKQGIIPFVAIAIAICLITWYFLTGV